MYQITFSEQSMREFNKMDKFAQLQFIDSLSNRCDAYMRHDTSDVKCFRRNGVEIYRCRIGDLRVYFEVNAENNTIFCRYTLKEHTFLDFLYRMKLPLTEEQVLEEQDSFWKYLESFLK